MDFSEQERERDRRQLCSGLVRELIESHGDAVFVCSLDGVRAADLHFKSIFTLPFCIRERDEIKNFFPWPTFLSFLKRSNFYNKGNFFRRKNGPRAL